MIRSKRGMTFVEILIVVSLISFISLALYNALSSGIKVWQRSNKLTTEENIAVFFDKLTYDLRNFYPYSKMKFKGSAKDLSFPTIVHIPADKALGLEEGTYTDQLGVVEYVFSSTDKTVSRAQAGYARAVEEKEGDPVVLLNGIEKLEFKYVYMTDNGEYMTQEVLETFPSWIEVHVDFVVDDVVHRMARYIEVPKSI